MRSNPSVDTRNMKTVSTPRQDSNLVPGHKFGQADSAIDESIRGRVGELGNCPEEFGRGEREVVYALGWGVSADPRAAGRGVEGDEANEEAEDDEEADEEDEFGVEVDRVVVRWGFGLRGWIQTTEESEWTSHGCGLWSRTRSMRINKELYK